MARNTHQKQVVLETLLRLKGQHPTADSVFLEVKLVIPTISRATVYRILGQVAEQGIVQRIRIPAAADRYDDRLGHHHHMRCTACGQVTDVDMPPVENLGDQILDHHGYRVTGYEITFTGLCPSCEKTHNAEQALR